MMLGYSDTMLGVQIIEDSSMADRVQIHFPRSKKQRIRKKWRRKPENWIWKPWTTIYQVGNHTLLMHPSLAAELRRELEHRSTVGGWR